MNNKNQNIDHLLDIIKELDATVSSVKQQNKVSFSFFRDAFQKNQKIMSLLHEMEMQQIEEMKLQMEKLVAVLSENLNAPQTDTSFHKAIDSLEYPENNPVEINNQYENENNFQKGSSFSALNENISSERNDKERSTSDIRDFKLPSYVNPRSKESDKSVSSVSLSQESDKAQENKLKDEDKVASISINDSIKTPNPKIDIKRGLSLNDRFYFQRELFENNRDAMSIMINKLNEFESFEDIELYLKENTSWNFSDQTVKSFMEIMKKQFD